MRGEICHCFVHFGRGGSITVVHRQVVVIGLAVNNGGGKVALFDLLYFYVYNLWIDNP